MKRFATTILAAVALTACFDDPTSDLRGGPAQIRLSRSLVFLAPGDSEVVTATLVDAQGNPVPGTVSFGTADAAVATAGDLPEDTLPGQLQSSGFIKGVDGGSTYVRTTGGGITDSVRVVVVPTTFTGTVAPATTTVGTPIVISATSLIGFDPAKAAVSVGGVDAVVISATATTLTIAAPTVASGTMTISGLVLLGNIVITPLDATTQITVTDPGEPANDGPPGSTITAPAAVGDSTEGYGSVEGNGAGQAGAGPDFDDFFTFTTPAGASPQNYEITVDWVNDAVDIDGFVLNAGGGGFCVLDGCSGASASDPEEMSVTLAPATTYTILVELWDNHGEATPIAYRVRITRVP